MKKSIYKISILVCFILLCLFESNVFAETTLKSGSLILYDSDEEINFKLSTSAYVVLDMNISVKDGLSKDECFTVKLKDNLSIKTYEDDSFGNFPDGKKDLGNYYDYSRDKLLPGNYYYRLDNWGNHDLKITYTIKAYNEYSSLVSFPQKSINMEKDTYRIFTLNKTPLNSFPIINSVKSTNINVAKVYYYKDKVRIDGISPGTCTVSVILLNGHKTNINITVTNPSNPQLKYISAKLYIGNSFQNELKYYSGSVKWKSSNIKVATVNKTGKIVCKGVGKCTITATAGKKTYKCNVEVIRQKPDFYGFLDDYYTRANYFDVEFENFGSKPLYIESGIKVKHEDYKTFDRNVYLKKKEIISPGKTKYVRFYVKGGVTWYDSWDYSLIYKFKYDGVTYLGEVSSYDSYFKDGKHWYNSLQK